MPKIAIVGFAILIATILVMLFIQFRPLQTGKAEQVGFSSNDLSGSARPSRYDNAELHHELLQQIKLQISSIDARLQALEQRPQTLPPGMPSASAPLPVVPPAQLPDGSAAPWAWIEQLAPDKKVSVERAFKEAAATARSLVPPGVAADHPTLKGAKATMNVDLAVQLRSLLSPDEFEAYLSSLPNSLRTQIENRRPENQ